MFGCDVVANPPGCLADPGDLMCIWLPSRHAHKPDPLLFSLDHDPLPTTVTAVAGGHRHCAKLTKTNGVLRVHSAVSVAPYLTTTILPRPDCAMPDPPESPLCRAVHSAKSARTALAEYATLDAIDHFTLALTYSAKAGAVTQFLNDATALAFTLTHRREDFFSARAVLALADLLSTADPVGAARVGYQSGLLAQKTFDFRNAFVRFQQTAEAAERFGLKPLFVHAAQQLAEGFAQVGRIQDSHHWHQQAMRVIDGLGPCEQARYHTNRGWSTWIVRQNQPETTADPMPYFTKALALHQSSCKNPGALANAWVNIALGLWQQSEGGGGESATIREALTEARKTGALSGEAEAWAEWLNAGLLMSDGHAAETIPILQTLVAQPKSNTDLAYHAYISLAKALERIGNLTQADAAWSDALATVRLGSRGIALGEGRVGFLGRGLVAVAGRVRLALSQGWVKSALDLVHLSYQESWREVVVFARLSAAGTVERSQLEFGLAQCRRLRDREAELQGRVAAAAQDELPGLNAELTRVRNQADALLDRTLSLASGSQPTAAPLVPGPDEIVLTILPINPGYVLFAQSGIARISHHPSATSADLPASAGRAPKIVLDWLQACLRAIFVRAPSIHGHLDALAANAGEKSGLLRVWTFETSIAGIRQAPTLLSELEPLSHKTRLRVVAIGKAFQLPIHALPFRDGIVLDHFHVHWSQNLGPTDGSQVSNRPAQVTVLGDPRNDLPFAREEAIAFADAARSGGLPTQWWSGSEVTVAVWNRALANSTFLYVAGHGESGGLDGLGSSLWLANNQQVYAGELLAFRQVPQFVVLSSCEGSANTSDQSFVPGMGLAQLLVAAGAVRVVASPHKIVDQCASIWAAHFRRLRPWDGPQALDEAYRAAVLALRERAPHCDWTSFRLLTR